jgi:hypothetical protein
VNASSAYNFVPTASDADGDTLAFSIDNSRVGHLQHVHRRAVGHADAADVGTYSNIAISVSDGHESTALSPFAIAVTAISNGHATLSWAAPTENTDGSTLSNLAGYRIATARAPMR